VEGDGGRAPREDGDCQKSDACQEKGACSPVEDGCLPRRDEDCAGSDLCRNEGGCGFLEDRCQPTKDEHCRQSKRCQDEGGASGWMTTGFPTAVWYPTPVAVRPGSASRNGDARRSPRLRWCGNLPHVALVEHRRWPLTKARHGIAGALVLSQDPKLPPDTAESGHYWPNEDDPRAAAALEVRDRKGAVVSEETLYPEVGIGIENLGSGTDTFVVTEHAACPGGHWCGPTTVFFEVHDASSPGSGRERCGERQEHGGERLLGCRWKIEQRDGRYELIEQVENSLAPVSSRPILVRVRSVSWEQRTADDYEPKVAKEHGQWRGILEFHGPSRQRARRPRADPRAWASTQRCRTTEPPVWCMTGA